MAYKDPCAAKAAARRFREANPGYGREQYAKHAEKRRAEKVAAYHADLDGSRQSQRNRYARNRERIREQQRAAYVPGSSTERVRKWERDNPERAAVHAAKRRLSARSGVAMRDIPDELAQAEAILADIRREGQA